MPRHKRGYARPLQDVFKMVDMKQGDVTQCWPWLGCFSPNPIFCWHGKRLQARRLVYALKNGYSYHRCPRVTDTCGNHGCCNPAHLVPRHGVIDKLTRASKVQLTVEQPA